MASIPRKDFLKKGMKTMECYKEISLKQAIDLMDEDVSCLFYRDKSCKSLHSFEQYGDELSFHDALCSTWFMREKKPHQSRQRLVDEQNGKLM